MELRTFADLKAEWLTDPAYAAEYERQGPIYEAAFSVAEARRKRRRKTKAAGGSAYD